MIVEYIDENKYKEKVSSENTIYILPFSGVIIARNIKESFVYVNGDALKVENYEIQLTVTDYNIELEVDRVIFDICVLCKTWPNEMLFDYTVFGNTYHNNLINNAIDAEILFLAIEEAEDEELKMSLCTFNRSFDNITKQMDVEQTLKLARRLPFVFHKPKQHLKQVNELRPAALATRIGQESISYLASHSEHWKAIKANGLVPDRLLARVLEDDYAIYENKVAKTLVDRMLKIAVKMKMETLDCEMQTEIEEGQSVSSEQGSYFHAREALLKGLDNDDIAFTQELLKEQSTQLDEIMSILSECKSTQLYRKLKREKIVRGKLKQTNIFMKDRNYKYVYRLWTMLETTQTTSVFDEIKPITDEYEIFCKILFHFALRFFNFELDDDSIDLLRDTKLQYSSYSYDDWNVRINEYEGSASLKGAFCAELSKKQEIIIDVSEFNIDRKTIKGIVSGMNFKDNQMIFTSVLSNQDQEKLVNAAKNSWPKKQQRKGASELKQKLYANFHNFSKVSKRLLFFPWQYCFSDNGEEIKETIKLLEERVNIDGFDESYVLTISRPNEIVGVENVEILNSMLSYGEANADKHMEKRNVGIIPISMNDINSYRRYTKILLKNMVAVDNSRETCPICSSGVWKNNNESSCINAGCDFTLIDTQCPNCKETYIFSRYPLSKLTPSKLDSVGFKILYEENRLSYKNITEAVIDRNQVNPICPCCGYNSQNK